MPLPATIYVRFSSLEQSRGDSKERQLRLCRDMAARHGWVVGRELVDEGKSAFSGANRLEGGYLHQFEKEAAEGHYQNGHVLILENLDRASRQGYDAVLPLLQELTSRGVTVATVDGDRVFAAHERVSMAHVIETVVKSELAREESAKKSLRNESAWAKKVERARDGERRAITRTTPAWIAVDPETRLMSPIPERVEVVREIFRLTIEGYGTPAIARRLNERGERVWNYRGVSSNNGWTVGYLTKLVLSRAVMGEYHPTKRPRGLAPTSKGYAILDYYPQIIDAVTWERAQQARQSRRGVSGAWQITHNNLFSGIATCASCGGRMKQEVTVRKGQMRNGKSGRYRANGTISYLKCHNALNKVWDEAEDRLRCENTNWVRYETLERAVLNEALKFVVVNRDVVADGTFAQLRIQIAEQRRHIEEKRRQIDVLVDSLARTGSSAIERRMLLLEGELSEDESNLRELERGLAAEPEDMSVEEYERRLTALLHSIDSDDEQARADARVQVKQSLRGLVTRMASHEDRRTLVEFGNAVRFVFDSDGTQVFHAVIQATVIGPDGEIDWHPDRPDADYKYHPSSV